MDNVSIVETQEKWSVPDGILAMLLGTTLIYSTLFATGSWIYQNYTTAALLTALAVVAGFALSLVWKRMGKSIL